MLTTIELDSPTPAKHSVIWLHGLGASGDDFVPIVPELQLPKELAVRFIFPHAPVSPVTINNGYEMPAWYDITGLQLDSVIDKNGILASIALIEELIQREMTRGIDANNIILGGFSQGAVMALTLGLRRTTPLRGIIALSGYFPLAAETLQLMNDATRNTPLFVAHGTEDAVVPYALGTMTYMTLKEAHCQVSWHAYPMGHSVCGEEIHDIGKWLEKVLGAR
jgi:phospholipase/carboxylesterase